ncbi:MULTISPECIES: phenylalanine--tRNA ligase subunit beta [Brevibacillus]|uniref:Phenylalanine--tRNA ligase beta subunit n=1 Tax=Brevibacillus parabrevis TaxID=54914 RepID=A0A4Y3PT75_BREPA|nr:MULTISPECIES: phenylalanine--tRNA ligase subunit beta [Brevibacillus]MDH6348576.1 phenylalanyl-tRNA synthetase beta chain [Brevibacillus sp. 1238]RNB96902.1 phenylalanine--tRNA ligase subunit beta [Brevibacillus parabrevis]UED70632.1 phenylalanine--tRNA ligase subunit beta [Brevibacillus sp. HD3.3A]GEB33531.1 phenylalanine--tRNA ligase beta subunit [Brevibacillus parabrevis]
MKVSYQWLSEYVDLSGMTPHELAEKLTRSGIEVDAVESRNAGVSGVVIGYVKERSKHPDADRLNVCVVDAGQGEDLQIVCGAPNVDKGQKVLVALIGAKLPGGLNIKRSKLRGVESQGMICSAKELGLNDKLLAKDQQEGIMVLPEDAEIGMDAISYLGLDDYVLELGLTPNRSDCLSMLGVAYEVAAILGKEVVLPQIELTENGGDNPLQVSIAAENECYQYHGRHFTNAKIATSPQWMKNRLMAAGVRPINNVVDVTNYVLLEYGQPLHAFDATQVQDRTIVVRLAEEGEKLVTLDDQERELDAQTLLITDPAKGLAIAGVMGGANSEITNETSEIILEAAWFTPQTVRRTARTLGMRTEGCVRWEKGVDQARVQEAGERAAALIQQLSGATVSKGIRSAVVSEAKPAVVSVTLAKINQHLGTSLSAADVSPIFERLQFPFAVAEDNWTVTVPTRRGDITLPEDLVEEVARLYGYDNIPTSLPTGTTTQGQLTNEQKLRRTIRHHLIGTGLNEAISYALVHPDRVEAVAGLHQHKVNPVSLLMPMSEEHSTLRTSLVPSLLETVAYNKNRQNHDVAIFELGRVFLSAEEELTQLPEERLYVAGALTGQLLSQNWMGAKQPVDFYQVKGIVDSLLARLGIRTAEYKAAADIAGMHPGRTAEVWVNDKRLGYLGQVHPGTEKAYDLSETYVFQFDVAELIEAAADAGHYSQLPKFPAVTRDLALVVDRSVPAGALEATIREAAGDLLESLTLFDVYTGERIAQDKKSMAFALVFRNAERTLQDEEIQQVTTAVVEALKNKTGAELRM